MAVWKTTWVTAICSAAGILLPDALGGEPTCDSACRCRLLLQVDCRGVERSHSPASVDLNFAEALSQHRIPGTFDDQTLEVIAHDGDGAPIVFDASRRG